MGVLSLAKRKQRPLFVDSLDGEGSLVLYCLGITRRNPLQYGLGFASFLSMERVRIPWFGIICRKEDTRSIYSEMVKKFGEDKVGLIPNGVGLLLNKTGLGEPVPYVIDDYTLERNFLAQPEEFEKNGIVPISLDLEKTLDDLVRLEGLIRRNVRISALSRFRMMILRHSQCCQKGKPRGYRFSMTIGFVSV